MAHVSLVNVIMIVRDPATTSASVMEAVAVPVITASTVGARPANEPAFRPPQSPVTTRCRAAMLIGIHHEIVKTSPETGASESAVTVNTPNAVLAVMSVD